MESYHLIIGRRRNDVSERAIVQREYDVNSLASLIFEVVQHCNDVVASPSWIRHVANSTKNWNLSHRLFSHFGVRLVGKLLNGNSPPIARTRWTCCVMRRICQLRFRTIQNIPFWTLKAWYDIYIKFCHGERCISDQFWCYWLLLESTVYGQDFSCILPWHRWQQVPRKPMKMFVFKFDLPGVRQ